ncbi:phosphatidylinositol 3,4,5-trisphosphate 3-phosphatase TPTE2-like protein isoform X1, putative [Babesia ovata]|uniref:Phosphatidylinositol 3,4,5-trisphosphate 3-phosphatase TPTE2-like protein isoform X1, putative n=1 Tax=Babesia ovata TaxID=189622 RepID=A0A2H6KEG8_9APIC|nr:phosphatidylinositol 3,4,5-trisphosphate 3-phosphatase TPTE2-like protein isoform X1, putative [Babesia ovata]GBE61386.1 phosphatidylinositol 3,4,5-trisphosphate 3-phosphatase TPTE2-like protein isoform X1, putative [Babesia ovata]
MKWFLSVVILILSGIDVSAATSAQPAPSLPKEKGEIRWIDVPRAFDDTKPPTEEFATNGDEANMYPTPLSPKEKGRIKHFPVIPAFDDTQPPSDKITTDGDEVKANGNPTPSAPKEKPRFMPSEVRPAFDDTKPPTHKPIGAGKKNKEASWDTRRTTRNIRSNKFWTNDQEWVGMASL